MFIFLVLGISFLIKVHKKKERVRMKWAYLIHLGYNMWRESDAPQKGEYTNASSVLRFDKETWDELLVNMVKCGVNTVVIDLGEGVKYESHPEISAEGAWTVDFLRSELAKMRKMGLQPIPKMNFSAAHDEWMGEYSRCVSSKIYYKVCKDLINEAIEIFDYPELFHLGMDEETYAISQHLNYAVIRHGDLWWHDFYYLVDCVEKKGVRPWIWSDFIWHHTDEFLKKMPKSVMQSNWYYGPFYSKEDFDRYINYYLILEKNGYDQIPCGSNWSCAGNFKATTTFCRDNIGTERLKGFLMAPWIPTLEDRKYRHLEAIDLVRQAK